MNNYGSMEEEKKSTPISSITQKLKSFTSKAQKPGADQKFESFHTDQDLEGQTISLREDDRGPKSMGSSAAQSTQESATANEPKASSFSESLG